MARILAVAPEHATTKGVIFDELLGQAPDRDEALRAAGIAAGRVGAFTNVPYVHYMKLTEVVAKMRRPFAPVGATIRDMARGIYPRFRETIPGRAIFGVLNNAPERVLAEGYRGWRMSISFGDITARLVGPRHIRYRFADYPSMVVEASDAGILQGAMDVLGRSRPRAHRPPSTSATRRWT